MLQPFRPKSSIYILSSILVVAAVLRFYAIDQPFIDAFSWRQGSTAMMAENFYRTNGNIFYPEVNWSGPGPNYQGREFQTVTYVAALFYHILGQQDWIGRSVAVVFGLWGIFALYQLVRCVWDEPRALARTYPPHHFAGGGNWMWDLGLKTLIEETYYLPKLFERIQGWLWTPPVLLLVGCGLLLPVAQKPAIKESVEPVDKPIWLFHGWLLANVLLFLVGPREIVGNPWNLHLVNPAAAALSGHALVSLARRFQQTLHLRLMFLTHAATWWVAVLLPLALFLAIGVYGRSRLPFLYYPYAGQSYQVGQALRQLSAPDELVITMANALGDSIPKTW